MPPKTTAPPLPKPAVTQPVQEGRCQACPGPTHKPVHRECQRRMCKQCCIGRGGCTAPKHQLQYLSVRQQTRRLHPPAVTLPAPPSTLPSVRAFTSMQHILESVPLPTPMLPPLHQDQRPQEEQLSAEEERQIVQQEEHDFQAGIAASLGLPVTASITPPALTSQLPPPSLSTPILPGPAVTTTTPNQLRTLPYRTPNITRHMNSDWMRPLDDRSKETPRRRKRDPNQRFRLVFWGEVRCSECH